MKRKFTINIDEWNLGEWPDDLWKAVEVEKTDCGIDITLDSSVVWPTTRKIAREAIEVYLNDANWALSHKGLEVLDVNCETQFTVPWGDVRLMLDDRKAAKKMQDMIAEVLAKWEKEEAL